MTPRKIIFWEVDVQADFMLPGGKLYVPGAEKIIPNVERLVRAARKNGIFLVSSGDTHAPGDPEFELFPPHCVKDTPGARILSEGLMQKHLTIPSEAAFALPANIFDYPQIVIEKQTLDVFDNPKASELVQCITDTVGRDTEYIVFGVVTEYCVRCAAKGLLERGCRVAVVKDAIETLKPEEGRRTLEELTRLGARLISTDEALQMAAATGAQKVI
jgi:nicotinamidase/pyrazinamidase